MFKRTVFSLAAFATAVSLQACGIVSNGASVLLTGEQCIIVWDGANKVEHFIRQAVFDSKAKSFGFIVPTPSVPDFGEVDPYAFRRLAQLTTPVGRGGGTFGGGGGRDMSPRVEVLKVEQVGDYLATIVRASDSTKLSEWMGQNGFVSRPALVGWLDGYIRRNWVFTALKYNESDGNEGVAP